MTNTEILALIYPSPEGFRGRRFTQDTPILPDVWMAYGRAPGSVQELLLTPHAKSSVQQLVTELRERAGDAFIGYNESHVLAELTFGQLIRAALPLSSWWQRNLESTRLLDSIGGRLDQLAASPGIADLLLDPVLHFTRGGSHVASDVLDMIRITGGILIDRSVPANEETLRDMVRAVKALLLEGGTPPPRKAPGIPPLWSVACNRTAEPAVSASRMAIKADAATRLFDLSCRDIVWAVIDSGIDANHPAFAAWPPLDPRQTGDCEVPRRRILESYDFTLLVPLQRFAMRPDDPKIPASLRRKLKSLSEEEIEELTSEMKERLRTGRPLEWEQLKPFLAVDHEASDAAPAGHHGTHVAGILAADWRKLKPGDKPPYEGYREPEESIAGICPDIRIYDLRVIGGETGSEFAILAALQFVRYLNMNRDKMVIHGVNLSFSLQHKVESYACGSTPVCQECERLVNSGVVVVAAAGNRGYSLDEDRFESYRAISITDPGNADAVITVGATHRLEPHRFGVSYFSSRGPTGDGRMKPDLVAPGEKIVSTVPGASAAELDGTSMAAPHVSGAAALLIARHQELIGRPRMVKEILCRTATDLGRERSFQGAGMLDVLRALQSV